MKSRIVGGAAIAITAAALALAGSTPSQARHKVHRAPKAESERHACGGKNGCPAMGKGDDKPGAAPAAKPVDQKPADAKPAEAKPADAK